MQVNVEKKRDSTKQKQENREAFNRHVAPDMREREKKKRTKDFLARQTENQKKETKVKKNQKFRYCTYTNQSISTKNPFDEHHYSTNTNSTKHRAIVDTPEDVFQLSVWRLINHY